MNFFRSVLFSILVISLIFSSSCNYSSASFFVPAVVGDGGGLVKAQIQTINGTGKIFVSTTPKIGETTQESLDESLFLAKTFSKNSPDFKSCDYLVSFEAPFDTRSVDGPSAGVAFTVHFYGLLNQIVPRNDTIITGAIDPAGHVLPVGGVYEKSIASTQSGFRFFLSPLSNIYETFLLKKVESSNPIKTYRVSNFEQIIGFMFRNSSISDDLLTQKRPLPNVSFYSSNFTLFEKVSLDMSSLLEKELLSIDSSNEDYDSIGAFYQNELLRQKILRENGYYFSSANEAFLNYIDLRTLKGIFTGTNLNSEKSSIIQCINSIQRPALSFDNYNYVFGSDLRKEWANQKLNSTNLSYNIYEEQIAILNDLSYSQGWCAVSLSLAKNAPKSNLIANESLLAKLAGEYQIKLSNLTTDSDDLNFRIKTSKSLFDQEKFGASLFDAQYVLTNYEFNTNPPSNISNASAYLLTFENKSKSSLWSDLYYSQSQFLLSTGDSKSALRLATLSNDLVDLDSKIRFALESEHTNLRPQTQSSGSSSFISLDSSTSFIVILFGLLFSTMTILFIMRRLRGGNSNDRRYKKYR